MYHFIVNPQARTGQGAILWETIKTELDNHYLTYDVVFTKYSNHAQELAYSICTADDTIKNLVVVGGDGTINEVINGIPDYDKVILSYIPLGSGNDLARGLEIGTDLLKNITRTLHPTKFRYIDHGVIHSDEINSKRTFAVSSSIGYDASVCYEVAHSNLKSVLNKYKLGKLTYIAIALKQIFTWKPVTMEISIDHATPKQYKNVLFVAAMIHKYEGGGVKMAPHANPTDGKLALCIVHNISRLQALILMPTAFFGKHTLFPMVETIQCSSVEITSERPCRVHTDGEDYGMQSHVIFSSKEKQIRMPY